MFGSKLFTLVLLGLTFITKVEGAISDVDLTLKEIVLTRNFSFEEHTVLTEDGYLLTLFRIPGTLTNI